MIKNTWLFFTDDIRILYDSPVTIQFISLARLNEHLQCVIRIPCDHKRHPHQLIGSFQNSQYLIKEHNCLHHSQYYQQCVSIVFTYLVELVKISPMILSYNQALNVSKLYFHSLCHIPSDFLLPRDKFYHSDSEFNHMTFLGK